MKVVRVEDAGRPVRAGDADELESGVCPDPAAQPVVDPTTSTAIVAARAIADPVLNGGGSAP
jgi:hypothetical protein